MKAKQKISFSALMAILLLQGLLFAFHQASASPLAKSEKPAEISCCNFSDSNEGQIASSPTIPSAGFASLNEKRFNNIFQEKDLTAFSRLHRAYTHSILSQTDFRLFLQSTNNFPLHLFYCILQI